MNIDEWYAEKCGVEWAHDNKGWIKNPSGGGVIFWTIQDPRCREICREKFKLISGHTCHPQHDYSAHAHIDTDNYYGKTIQEAEIACLTAIYEVER